MNLQEKFLVTSAEVRARAARGVARLHSSLGVLGGAGRELKVVARRHGARFVRQNSTLASAVGQDLSRIVRSAYESLAQRPKSAARQRTRVRRRRAAATA